MAQFEVTPKTRVGGTPVAGGLASHNRCPTHHDDDDDGDDDDDDGSIFLVSERQEVKYGPRTKSLQGPLRTNVDGVNARDDEEGNLSEGKTCRSNLEQHLASQRNECDSVEEKKHDAKHHTRRKRCQLASQRNT